MRLQEIERADENLVINEEQAKTVILIYGLYMSDLSSSVIGRDFKQDEKAHQGWWAFSSSLLEKEASQCSTRFSGFCQWPVPDGCQSGLRAGNSMPVWGGIFAWYGE